jgi:hypothetical protein
MAPKKETHEQKACRLARKVTALQQAADFQKCVALMKKEPHVVSSVKRHLISLEKWPSLDIVDTNIAQDDSLEAVEDAEKADVQVDFATFDFDINMEVHRNFLTWNKMPPKHMVTILHLTDPLAFNQRVLRNMCSKGQKVPPKEKLLELLEFATNIDPGSDIGDLRSIGEIATIVRGKNLILGKRAKELVVPVDWQEYGVYQFRVEDGQPVLYKVGSPATLDLPGVDITCLYISMNYSESRATLNSTTDLTFMKLCVLLHANGLADSASEPSFKRQKMSDSNSGTSAGGTPCKQESAPSRCESSGSEDSLTIALGDLMSSQQVMPDQGAETIPGVAPVELAQTLAEDADMLLAEESGTRVDVGEEGFCPSPPPIDLLND